MAEFDINIPGTLSSLAFFDGVSHVGDRFVGSVNDMQIRNTVFEDCDFSRVRIDRLSAAAPTVFRRCRFDRCRIGTMPPVLVDRVDCEFSGCKIKEWMLRGGDVTGCSFSGVIRSLVFWVSNALRPGIPFHRNVLAGNDFSRVDFKGAAAFPGGVDLSQNVWPDNPDSFLFLGDGRDLVRRTREAVEAWPDAASRERALSWLSIIGEDVDGGQRDIFVGRAVPEKVPYWDALPQVLADDAGTLGGSVGAGHG